MLKLLNTLAIQAILNGNLTKDELVDFYRDEITDRDFYVRLAKRLDPGDFQDNLLRLSRIEERHSAFWKRLLQERGYNTSRIRHNSIKLMFLMFVLRFLGLFLTVRLLEHGEIRAIKSYREFLDNHQQDDDVKEGVRSILKDEIEHEEVFASHISKNERMIQRNQDIIYGISDGLVEVLGSISGLAAIFLSGLYVALGGLVIAVSGAMSMALGAYLSNKSKTEYQIAEIEKRSLFNPTEQQKNSMEQIKGESKKTAATTAASYLLGSSIPIIPYLVLGKIEAFITSIVLVGLFQALVNSIIALSTNTNIKRAAMRSSLLSVLVALVTFSLGDVMHIVFHITL